ncbi:MAG: Hsp33 family molecular chaperone HslO [Desulfuromonas sp.]|nr:MAG: Hsp33 family molecular chaperone HslO [Desulfuromonas sp.]
MDNQGRLVRVVSDDGLFRAMAVDSSSVVAEVCRRQQTDLTATVALGRLLTAGALLGCLLKGTQRLALMVEGNGPLGRLAVETDATGRLRGSVRNPRADLPPRDGRFDVSGAIGRAGFLHVTKDLGLKEPYRSMVQLQTSEIGDDLAYYLSTSEQVPSSVAVGVELAKDGSVAAAGGFIVQALPPGNVDAIAQLEVRLGELPPTTTMLRDGLSPAEIMSAIFAPRRFAVQAETSVEFFCPCTRMQIERVLIGLGRQELQSQLEEQEEIQVTCEYCKEVYPFTKSELEALIRSL